MNILIEDETARGFLNDQGGWTKNPLEGKIFKNRLTALGIARHEAIARFNIVLHLPQNNQFINLDHGRGKGLAEESAA